ncbi:DUF2829 domain-containing protein [Escherichia coli]|nr:DUF2829 domain-containing protein [Escherichia coli]
MQQYIGIKRINAISMTRAAYNELRGWTLPDDENGDDDGYLVEYLDSQANTARFSGYVSWSPKEVFARAYRQIDDMTFGLAIEALKKGHKVARTGWNGKGLWLELQQPGEYSKMTLPYIFMSYPDDAKTTPGARVPWLASQTDVLAEDWVLVD